MAETLSPRLEINRWSADSDTFSRSELDSSFGMIETYVAFDPGDHFTTLPAGYGALNPAPKGSRATVRNDPYITEYRRDSTGVWQVAGNTDPGTRYLRAPSGASATSRALETSVVTDLTNATAWLLHKGGGRFSGLTTFLDTNTAANTALHVGVDTAAAPSTLGRVHARTIANGDLGVVARGHSTSAGYLFSAQVGASDVWTVDAQGRMQGRAPSALGLGTPTTGVALVSTALADGTSAGRFYGNTTPTPDASALQAYGHVGDGTPLLDVKATIVDVGHASFTGALNLRAATINTVGALSHVGTSTLTGAVTVVGALSASGALSTSSTLAFQGGASSTVSGTTTLTTLVKPGAPAALAQSVRQARVFKVTGAPGVGNAPYGYGSFGTAFDVPFTLTETGWIRAQLTLTYLCDNGAAGAVELSRSYVRVSLRSADNATELEAPGTDWAIGMWNFAPSAFRDSVLNVIDEMFPTRRDAGNYILRVHWCRDTTLAHQITFYRLNVTPVVAQFP